MFIGLCKLFEQCTDKPHPEAHRPEIIYAIKDWLDPYAEDIHRHVQPHRFNFEKNANGKAVMFYRKWGGESWLGPVQLLKVNI